MYNALNPIHYIALHNENEVLPMLTQQYALPMPKSHAEYFSMVDYATAQYGDTFIDSMISVHPDRELFVRKSGFTPDNYVVSVKQYNLSQLNSELESLTAQFGKATDSASKIELLDTIAFVQKQIIEKQKQAPTTELPGNSIHKTNQYLLLALTAIVLMFIGSKIFKQ